MRFNVNVKLHDSTVEECIQVNADNHVDAEFMVSEMFNTNSFEYIDAQIDYIET